MIIKTTHYPTKDDLVWATYMVLRDGGKATRKIVLQYLREQMSMFGDQDFLKGSEWGGSSDEHEYLKAKDFVENNWPRIK